VMGQLDAIRVHASRLAAMAAKGGGAR
jgi:hypothetical protein